MSIKVMSKITMKGFLNTDGQEITIETSDLGDRSLKDEIASFNGEDVSIVVTLNKEITE